MTDNGTGKALISLTVSEGKRLIGKAVAALPQVQAARKQGKLIIATGITNAYVAEEVLQEPVEKMRYTAGVITQGVFTATSSETRLTPVCFENGERSSRPWLDILQDFTGEDVFIKGANAVDPSGMAGVLVGAPNGGTIGSALGTLYARGSHLIIPVSREKLIPSVEAAVRQLGIHAFDDTMGMACGMIPVVGAAIITEVEALDILCGVEAVQVSGGGVGGSEGSVGLVVSGPKPKVAAAMELVRAIKGEPPIV
ncbi:MAG: hypothetical protein GX341_01515 [Firmicutes bacterium]|jgi:hypothetical protein|nr:hypothetical protein [Bacillota bacterium]